MDAEPQLPSDGQLLAATHDGMSGAWDELQRRHVSAVTAVARATRRWGAKKAVTNAVQRVHSSVVAGDDPGGLESRSGDVGDVGERSVRARMLGALTGGHVGPGTAIDSSVWDVELGDPSAPQPARLDDLGSLARAFATLPEPWQTALWHRLVERQPAAEYAPLVGRTATESAAFVQRADAGLFEAFLLDQRIHAAIDLACLPIIPLLGGAVRETLSAHEQRIVRDHLDGPAADANVGPGSSGCRACGRRLAINDQIPALLPAAIVPDLTTMTVDRYRAVAGVSTPATMTEAADERRRKLAFAAIFASVVLAAAAAVVFVRGSLEPEITTPTDDTSQPVSSGEPGTTGADGSTTSLPETVAPTTTELELRPTGTANTVEIVFGPPADVNGFASALPPYAVDLSSPAPAFIDGTSTLDMTITNPTDQAVGASARLDVPSGVLFDTVVDGAASCVDPPNRSASCDLTVGPDETAVFSLRFTLSSEVSGRLVFASALAAEDLELQMVSTPRLLHTSVEHGQVVMIGNTLMTCSESAPACADARNGEGEIVNRWDLPMEYVDTVPSLGWGNSSSAMLDIGAGTVDAAYLFWSGDLSERNVVIPDDGRSGRVSILPPGADAPIEVEADRVRLGDIDATQYFGAVDVTDLVATFGPGEYTVGSVESVEVQGSYAGWSLAVVTKDATLPRRSMTITTPFSWFSPADVYAIGLPVPVGVRTTSLKVLAFEGERGFVPEQFSLGGESLGDSNFDSTIIGERTPSYDNNFGIDIDAYDLTIDAPTGNLAITATSGKDGIRLTVLAFAVDVG